MWKLCLSLNYKASYNSHKRSPSSLVWLKAQPEHLAQLTSCYSLNTVCCAFTLERHPFLWVTLWKSHEIIKCYSTYHENLLCHAGHGGIYL